MSYVVLPSTKIFRRGLYRLVAAPRITSTNGMHDDRLLHLAHWATEQGIDPLG